MRTVNEIGRDIARQDNRATKTPIFIVQQRRRLYGLIDGYAEGFEWLTDDDEPRSATADEAATLEREFQDDGDAPAGWQRMGYVDLWEFVTACFTEAGCRRYLAANGHNLRAARIYAETGWRNDEWQTCRQHLMDVGEDLPVAGLSDRAARASG